VIKDVDKKEKKKRMMIFEGKRAIYIHGKKPPWKTTGKLKSRTPSSVSERKKK